MEYRGRWSASITIENRKLGNKEDDWNLACGSSLTTSLSGSSGLRSTWYGGEGRPNLLRREFNEATSSSDDSSYECSDTEEEEEEEEDEGRRPPCNRVIMEVSALTETLTSNVRCSDCLGQVNVLIKNLCLSPRIVMTCKNTECGFFYNSPAPAAATLQENDENRKRTTDMQ
jgi:hypothetical protein